MISRDYTQEIGLSTGDKKVPLFIAIPVLATIAIGAWCGLVKTRAVAQHASGAKGISVVMPPAGPTVASR